MRWDYILYGLAVVCFALAGCAQIHCPAAPMSTAITAVIGVVLAVVGYLKRPKK